MIEMIMIGFVVLLGLIVCVCDMLERRMWRKRVSKRREEYMSKVWMDRKKEEWESEVYDRESVYSMEERLKGRW